MNKTYAAWLNFGSNLQSARLAAQYSQQQLANLVGCHRSYITLLEAGKRCPSVKMIRILAATCPQLLQDREGLTYFEELARYHIYDDHICEDALKETE